MESITKPSITRLARKAGIKSISDDSYGIIYNLITNLSDDLVKKILIVNDEQNTKTIMVDDVYKAIRLSGYNISQSSDLGTSTTAK